MAPNLAHNPHLSTRRTGHHSMVHRARAESCRMMAHIGTPLLSGTNTTTGWREAAVWSTAPASQTNPASTA